MPRRKKRAYGTGTIYRPKTGDTYTIRWMEHGAPQFQAGFDSKELAERVLDEIIARVRKGDAGLISRSGEKCLNEHFPDFMKHRKQHNASWRDDEYRWNNHIAGPLGHHKPDELTADHLTAFIYHKVKAEDLRVLDGDEIKRIEGINAPVAGYGERRSGGTIGLCIKLVSALYKQYLLGKKPGRSNPTRDVPRLVLRVASSKYDWTTTPYVKSMDDVQRIFDTLTGPTKAAYAIGVMSGMRPSEIRGLHWTDIDWDRRLIHVQRQVSRNRIKDLKTAGANTTRPEGRSRFVPIQVDLMPELRRYQEETGGRGMMFRPLAGNRGGRPGSPPQYIGEDVFGEAFEAVRVQLELPEMDFYQATKHTFASHWVLNGRPIDELARVLGHGSVEVTRRYAHLSPDLFRAESYSAVKVDLTGQKTVASEPAPRYKPSTNSRKAVAKAPGRKRLKAK